MKEKIEFDKYELGIIINALNVLRVNQIEENKPDDPINELILKLIPIYEKTQNIKCLEAR